MLPKEPVQASHKKGESRKGKKGKKKNHTNSCANLTPASQPAGVAAAAPGRAPAAVQAAPAEGSGRPQSGAHGPPGSILGTPRVRRGCTVSRMSYFTDEETESQSGMQACSQDGLVIEP